MRYRRHITVTVAAALAGVLSVGCNRCEERVANVDVIPGDDWYDYSVGYVGRLREQGWSCTGATIRNADGADIGTAYRCTICD